MLLTPERLSTKEPREVGALVVPLLADRYSVRLEAARRHSVIRVIDKKPDQWQTVPTSALFAVFLHTLIRCAGFFHRDVIRGDIRDRRVVSDSPER